MEELKDAIAMLERLEAEFSDLKAQPAPTDRQEQIKRQDDLIWVASSIGATHVLIVSILRRLLPRLEVKEDSVDHS